MTAASRISPMHAHALYMQWRAAQAMPASPSDNNTLQHTCIKWHVSLLSQHMCTCIKSLKQVTYKSGIEWIYSRNEGC